MTPIQAPRSNPTRQPVTAPPSTMRKRYMRLFMTPVPAPIAVRFGERRCFLLQGSYLATLFRRYCVINQTATVACAATVLPHLGRRPVLFHSAFGWTFIHRADYPPAGVPGVIDRSRAVLKRVQAGTQPAE